MSSHAAHLAPEPEPGQEPEQEQKQEPEQNQGQEPDSGREAFIAAAGLSLTTSRGPVYRVPDFEALQGEMLVLKGPSGSGRTALALTLCGRMKPTEGSLTVAGLSLPRSAGAVQRMSALAEMPGVNPLEEAMSVRDHLRERLDLAGPFSGLLGSRSRKASARLAEASELLAGLAEYAGCTLSPETALVRDLPALERFVLGVALSLLTEPRILVVDDVDRLRAFDDRAAAWDLLAHLPGTAPTVIATCVETDALGPAVPHLVVDLTNGPPAGDPPAEHANDDPESARGDA